MYPFRQGAYFPGMYSAGPQFHQIDLNVRKDEKESKMDGINSDKVNIHLGGTGDGGAGNGAAMAALVAALGNRNNGGGDNAALVAALGNRNNDGLGGAALLGPLLAGAGGGFGNANGLWPILLLALLGRGGFGFGGRDGDCHIGDGHGGLTAAIAAAVNGLTSAVPTTALETQGVVQSAIAQLALAGQQGFASTKDSVQNASSAQLLATAGVKDSVMNLGTALATAICGVNQNISEQGCQTREAVGAGTDRVLTALQNRWTADDLATITALRNEVTELRNDGRRRVDHDDLRLQITNTNTAVAAQQQAQQQFQVQRQNDDLACQIRELRGLVAIGNQLQVNRQAQDIVNLGTMTGSATQAAANTQVR